MGAYCNANRKIYLSNNQEELIKHLEEEIEYIKLKRTEENGENNKNGTLPLHGLKIDMLPSCQLIVENLRKTKIPENLFDEAKSMLSSLYNYVEDDNFENAIKTKNEFNSKYFKQTSTSSVESQKNEIKENSADNISKDQNNIKS